jgi:hypothetical protein
LEFDVRLEGFQVVSGFDDSYALASFKRHGLVAIRLRVFDGRAVLLLEAPGAKYLSCSFLRKLPDAPTPKPTDDELVALSFICSDILANSEGFAEQRAYLSGIRFCLPSSDSHEETTNYLSQLAGEVQNNRAAIVQCTARLRRRPYAAALVLCPKVTRRIAYHARFSAPQQMHRKVLKQIVGKLSARVSTPVVPALALCALKPGDELELARDLKSCLVQIFREGSTASLNDSSFLFELEGIERNTKLKVRSC